MEDVIICLTDDEVTRISEIYIGAWEIMCRLGISRSRALRLMHRVRCVTVIDKSGRRARRILAIRREDFWRLYKRRGNPRFRDSAFQRQLAFRRWRRPGTWKPDTATPGTYLDEYGLLRDVLQEDFAPRA